MLYKLWPQKQGIIKNLKPFIDVAVPNNSLLYSQVLFKDNENVCLLEAPIRKAENWGQYRFF